VPPFGAEQGLTLMYSHLYAPPPVAAARRAGLPAAVDPVLARALAKDPADRYPSCGRFAAELRAALGLGSVLRAGPAPSHGPARPAPSQPTATQPAPAQPAPAQASSAQPSPARPAPGRPGRRVTASLAGASLLIAPARGEFTPAPLSREVTPMPQTVGDWPTQAADWLVPGSGPEPGGGPPASPSQPQGGRWRSRPALAAVAVIVVFAVAAAAFTLSRHQASGYSAAGVQAASPRTSPSISPTAASSSPPPSLGAQQAAALDTLLISSSTARTALYRAVKQVAGCANLPGAVSDLQNVVNQRAGEYHRAMALPVSALPDGAKVKSALTTALRLSLQADQDYLTWARQQRSSGCTPSSQSGTYNAAFGASQRADNAKAAFVTVWNPDADRYGLARTSPRDI
jgi:hypothetical protein